VEGASVEQIAAKAGVARTTLYRRWKSKEALLAEALGQVRADSERVLPDWRKMPADEIVALLASTGPELVSRLAARKLIARLIGSVPNNPELMAAYWANQLEPRRRLFGEILEKAQSDGRISSKASPDLLQDIIAGAVIYRVLVHPGRPSTSEMRCYFSELLDALGLTPS
jgi:AcrR family transcriptional regulator